MNKYHTLISNTALISIGTFASKFLVFFMVRFYTGYLSPSDYGTADLITQTANLLLPLISMGIADGVFRFALDHPKGRKTIFSIGIYTITAGSLIFLAIIPLLHLVKAFYGYIWLIVLFTMASCYHSLCSQFVRAKGNTLLYTVQGLLNTILVIVLNILFLAIFCFGITGYVLSVAISDIVCTIFLFAKEKLWKQVILKPKFNAFRQMLCYSVPLIPTTVFWWVISVSDRYMVNAFIGTQANGIYTMAYKVSTILFLVSGIFMEAWQFSAISEALGDRREHIRFFSNVWNSFQAVMFLLCGLIIAFSKIEIWVLSDKNYFSAWQYVPLLCVSTVFASFVTFMGSVYMVEKKSELSLWTSLFGALLNILLNFLLIPSAMGVQGAAFATFASYFAVFIIRAISTRKLLSFHLHIGRLVSSSFVLAIQVFFIIMQFSGWETIQAACILALLILNYKPVLLSAYKIIQLKEVYQSANRNRKK